MTLFRPNRFKCVVFNLQGRRKAKRRNPMKLKLTFKSPRKSLKGQEKEKQYIPITHNFQKEVKSPEHKEIMLLHIGMEDPFKYDIKQQRFLVRFPYQNCGYFQKDLARHL